MAGSASYSFSPVFVAEGYRYLRIRCRASVAMTVRLTLASGANSKWWDLDVTTSDANYDLDLCNPHSVSAPISEEKHYRWPEDATDGVVDEAEFGDLAGVWWFDTLTISNITSGESFTHDYIELRRLDESRITCLPEFESYVDLDDSATPDEGQRKLVADVDGKIGFDVRGAERNHAGTVYTQRTITQAIADINAIDGWTATAGVSFPDSINDNDRSAHLIGGAGETFDWGTDAWENWYRKDISASTVDIYAQALWDEVQAYPGAGENAWEAGAYSDTPFPLRISKHLRAQAWGLVLEEDTSSGTHSPASGGQVKAFETASPATGAGNGTPDTRGRYRTLDPYGKGDVEHTVECEIGTTPYLSEDEVWQNRRMVSALFKINPAELFSSVAIARHNNRTRLAYAYFEDDNLTIGCRQTAETGALTGEDTGEDGATVGIHYDRIRPDSRLLVVWENLTGNIIYGYTLNEKDIATVATIASGEYPVIVSDDNGLRYIYWIDGTAIKGQIRDAQDQIVVSTFTPVASGVEAKGLAAEQYFVGLGRWKMALGYISAGSFVQLTSDDGQVFV